MKNLNPNNLEIFRELFNWKDISDISEDIIKSLLEILGERKRKNYKLDCSWGYFKKCRILSPENTPLYFFKYVRDHYFPEVLAVHLTKNFFDPELGFQTYMTGIYHKSFWKFTSEIPYLMTNYIQGKDLTHHDVGKFKFTLGRMNYLHEVLCLYDVYDRHFIVQESQKLKRIDFGRAFENMHKKYLGFHDYLNNQDELRFYDEEYQEGYEYEKNLIRKNLTNKRSELAFLIRKIKNLTQDYELVEISPEPFINRLIDHWSRIGFLEDAAITQYEWI